MITFDLRLEGSDKVPYFAHRGFGQANKGAYERVMARREHSPGSLRGYLETGEGTHR